MGKNRKNPNAVSAEFNGALIITPSITEEDFTEFEKVTDGCFASADGGSIVFTGSTEKATEARDMIKKAIEFLSAKKYSVSGDVKWRGQAFEDIGVIKVRKNRVTAGLIGWWIAKEGMLEAPAKPVAEPETEVEEITEEVEG